MQYEFLKNFPKRMKNVGLYALLIQNSIQKTTWKQYGFSRNDEQLNLVFAVLMYIMEQSLKEENCTMDDIGAYIDTINVQYFEKNMSYESCRLLGEFVVNTILSNEGKVMYFEGYDFGQKSYQAMHISYVANKIVYVDQEIRRTSYYLTDDGYNLLLSTLEIENNMKLNIHEMIFQMHLERQSYDQAVDEIKNIFNLLRIQMQKIQEAMEKIRRNALSYSVKDYEKILLENLDTISDTKKKFQTYQQMVHNRVKELEEENINIKRLDKKDEENLRNLQIIEQYLNRAVDEYQRILNSHFDLKSLYTKELEQLSQVSFIKRFSLRTQFYDKVLENPSALSRLDYFLRPLFNQEIPKTYNLNTAFQFQRPSRKKEREAQEELLDFDVDQWQQEQERIRIEKQKRYQKSLGTLLSYAVENGEISLKEISERTAKTEESKENLIPNVEIFKEIMVELIKARSIELALLKKERMEYIHDQSSDFNLGDMILRLCEEEETSHSIKKIEIYRSEGENTVIFERVKNEHGEQKSICCSNVTIRIIWEDERDGI